ncbi:serine proteinase [Mariannaea sp. PMI_226]|nr:serine proteinase [Mariannaea sp. PMI_226]
MAAVTAIYNSAMPDDTSISLFYNTSTAQLAVALKNGGQGPDPEGKSFEASESDYTGCIVKSSQLTSGSFRGFDMVIAVTKPNVDGGRPAGNQISMISPVYQGLASTTLENKKVAISQSTTNCWVYFLDGTKDQAVLKEFNFATTGVASYRDGADVMLNSSLGAWYDPQNDERFVVYQESKGNHLKQFNLITRDNQDIVSTSDATAGTPIAVTAYEGRTYLYYTDTSHCVRRVTKANGSWGSSQVVRDSPPIGDSQMSVITANGLNHLFYLPRADALGPQNFSHIVEPIG